MTKMTAKTEKPSRPFGDCGKLAIIRRTVLARIRKKKNPIVLIVIIVVAACVAMMIGAVAITKYKPSTERADLNEVFKLYADEEKGIAAAGENEYAIVMQTYIADERAIMQDGEIYVPYALAKEYFDDRIYFDYNEDQFIFTNAVESKQAEPGNTYYSVDGEKKDLGYAIVIKQDSQAYVAIDFISSVTPVTFVVSDNPNHIYVTYDFSDVDTASVKKDTQIRKLGGIKSPIVADVTKGDEVLVVEELDDWTRVMTKDGYLGYLKSNKVTKTETKDLDSQFSEPEYTSNSIGKKVCLAWNNMGGTLEEITKNDKSLNVISPCWLSVSDGNGNVKDSCSSSYIKSAHGKGYQVWAMVDDFNLEDGKESIRETLSHTSARKALVNNLVSIAKQYGLDGINLDFEYINEETADDFMQFMREISIACHENDIIISMDNYPPSEYRAYYDLAEQGKLMDYVVIMAYDHYRGTGNTGANSDTQFISDIIETMSTMVDPEKTVIAVPFYSREWRIIPASVAEDGNKFYENEEYGRYTLEQTTYMMPNAIKYLANATWQSDINMYYYEYTEDQIIHQYWIENAETIDKKLELISSKDMGGVAFWQLGQETSDVWSVVAKYY